MCEPLPDDHRPTASLSLLAARARLLADLRAFFDRRGFLEVQTPCLSWDTVVDEHLDPIAVDASQLGLGGPLAGHPDRNHLYLQTSPELAMKRIVAAGMQAIYQIGPAFRAGEWGEIHNPEFTMLEWYRVGDTLETGTGLLIQLAEHILGEGGGEVTVRRTTYRRLFQEVCGWDPLESPLSVLAQTARSFDRPLADRMAEDRDGLLDFLMTAAVEPAMPPRTPLLVTHYPLSQAALARASPEDPATAERFELFYEGLELANGYAELLDPQELEQRARRHQRRRLAAGKAPLPTDSRLIAAMRFGSGLPRCSGTALGVDRLLMVRTGQRSLRDVLAFPIDRA